MSETITPEEVTRREAEVAAVLAKNSADAAVALAPLPVILQVPGVPAEPEAKSTRRPPRFPKIGAGHTISKHEIANAQAAAQMNDDISDLGPSEAEESMTREEIVASRTAYVASHTPPTEAAPVTHGPDLFGRFERAATEAQKSFDAEVLAGYRAEVEPLQTAGRAATARFEKLRDAHGSRLLKLASYNWSEIVRRVPLLITPGTDVTSRTRITLYARAVSELAHALASLPTTDFDEALIGAKDMASRYDPRDPGNQGLRRAVLHLRHYTERLVTFVDSLDPLLANVARLEARVAADLEAVEPESIPALPEPERITMLPATPGQGQRDGSPDWNPVTGQIFRSARPDVEVVSTGNNEDGVRVTGPMRGAR